MGYLERPAIGHVQPERCRSLQHVFQFAVRHTDWQDTAGQVGRQVSDGAARRKVEILSARIIEIQTVGQNAQPTNAPPAGPRLQNRLAPAFPLRRGWKAGIGSIPSNYTEIGARYIRIGGACSSIPGPCGRIPSACDGTPGPCGQNPGVRSHTHDPCGRNPKARIRLPDAYSRVPGPGNTVFPEYMEILTAFFTYLITSSSNRTTRDSAPVTCGRVA